MKVNTEKEQVKRGYSLVEETEKNLRQKISTYSRLHISTRVETFDITAIFFNSVYPVEISARDENLHIMSPLFLTSGRCKNKRPHLLARHA